MDKKATKVRLAWWVYEDQIESLRAKLADAEELQTIAYMKGKFAGRKDAEAKLASAEPVVAVSPDELSALRRFDECAMDDESYDVSKEMMKRLAEIGLVRRVSGNYYEHTDFGLAVLRGQKPAPDTLQDRVKPWMLECFGAEIAADKLERGDRFLEESLELLQSGDYPKERAYALIEYVYGRAKGQPLQEVGGVMITLAAYCLAHGLDMHEAGETELARITQPEIIEKIRRKQSAKPTGSALPIATQPAPDVQAAVE